MADPNAAAAKERIGSVLKDRWVLEDVLGLGGMAAVYAARHRNGARAAIKILHGAISEDAVVRERFLREAYLANSVGHRGTVQVLDDDFDPRLGPFIVMELLDGAGVLELLERGVVFDVPLSLDLADQTLDVLASAHARGIIHRDLKPANLFLCRDGMLKVLDFGIARMLEENAQRLTRTGVPIGTPAYMAPEQARGLGRDVDGRADVYAMGATLFRILAGRHVHVGKGAEQIAKVAMQRAPKIATVAPTLPADVANVIDRALEFEPERRYADARQMQADVRALLAGKRPPVASVALPVPSSVPALPPLSPRRRPPPGASPSMAPPPDSRDAKDEIFTQLAESAREAARAEAQKPDAFSARRAIGIAPGSGLGGVDDEDVDDMPTQVATRPEMELGPRPLVAAFAQLRNAPPKPTMPPPSSGRGSPQAPNRAAMAATVPAHGRPSKPPMLEPPTLPLAPPATGAQPMSGLTMPQARRPTPVRPSASSPAVPAMPSSRPPSPARAATPSLLEADDDSLPTSVAPARPKGLGGSSPTVPRAPLSAPTPVAPSPLPAAPAPPLPAAPENPPARSTSLIFVALAFFVVGVALTFALLRFLRG